MTDDQIKEVVQKVLQTHPDAAATLAKDRTYPMAYQDLAEDRFALDTLNNAIYRDLYYREVDQAHTQASERIATVTRDLDRARPFLKHTEWRTTPMYKNWDLELIEAAYGDNIAITRSRYGYRVMATPHMQSLDVDFSMAYCVDAQRKQAIEDLKTWIEKHPGQIWKVYETAKGLRFIRIDSPAPPDEQYIEMAKTITNADRYYAELCVEQGAYRLRVSAKPWRIGSTYPEWSPYYGHFGRNDWRDDKFDLAAENAKYDELAAGYRVAHLAADWKMNEVFYAPPALKDALQGHDTLTGASRVIAEANSLKDEEWSPLETDRAEPADIICHDLSLSRLVAFNRVYRSTGMCPPLIWHFLDDGVSMALRVMEGEKIEDYAREEWNAQRELCQKWCGTKIPTFDAVVKAWEGEQIAPGQLGHSDSVPPSFHDAHYQLKLEKRDAAQKTEAPAEPTDSDEDFVAKLANRNRK
jgi:hypothetical protein